jgi:hypothetical protein
MTDCLRSPGTRDYLTLRSSNEDASPMDKRQRQLKRLYEEVFIRVKMAVHEADPEQFLVMGRPYDEYDPAVAELTRRLIHGQGMDRTSIETWFASHFGMQPEGVEGIADSLLVIARDVQDVLERRDTG